MVRLGFFQTATSQHLVECRPAHAEGCGCSSHIAFGLFLPILRRPNAVAMSVTPHRALLVRTSVVVQLFAALFSHCISVYSFEVHELLAHQKNAVE